MDFLDALNVVNNATVKIVPDETRFWMIRTKRGYFYDEFIESGI